ncbi:hypothetical protein C4561_01185 [candidate division WWE3 bacterium]|jgi:glutaredoxin/uncharacterized protein (DUF302 family)|uniref:Glutaredoxin domain-containing protein n=1 Tax=candidate division WWE3 bacterium TaxID=2053526 RepID=A0A3A4ZFR9_UNCKA|nr:MAG: hypothetical protein C4561_01185 [candidate division WWE3 bacterium]
MNLAYFRKSTFSKEDTIKNITNHAERMGFKVLSESELNDNTHIVQICSKSWLETIVKEDKQLIGLLPCSVLVTQLNSDIFVGAGNPAVLGGVSQNEQILKLSVEAEEKIRELINSAAGVGELKPTSIKLYSTTTCPYCKMEQKWLEDNKIEYELIYVDRDQEKAQYLVNKTGQMGVPVTELEYEDMDSEFVVGFNKYALEKLIK